MKRSFALPLAIIAGFVAVASACSRSSPSAAPTPAVDPVKRGEQLVTIGGCNDCHTPLMFDPKVGMPAPQMDRMLSGHPEGAPDPAATPGAGDSAVMGATMTSFRTGFGVVYAKNLTPDVATGLGSWDADRFVRAMRTGHDQGDPNGRPILPPMPWMGLAAQSDDDLRAIFAYLRTIPAVSNRVPDPKVAPPALEAFAKNNDHIAQSIASRSKT
jgi:hypothetical protein